MSVNNLLSEQWQDLLVSENDLLESAFKVLPASEFITQWGERHAERARALLTSGDMGIMYDQDGYQSRLSVYVGRG